MPQRLLIAVLTAALCGLGMVRADEAAKPASPAESGPVTAAAAIRQERLARQFKDFEQALLRLAQRLESSSKPEDREKAAILKKAIAKAGDAGIDTKFDRLVNVLRNTKEVGLDELGRAAEQNKDLVKDIQEILNILMTDNREAELRAEAASA